MPLIDETLKKENLELKDIDYFAVSEGPGTFTGIRISIAAIRSFAYVFNKKIITLNNLNLALDFGAEQLMNQSFFKKNIHLYGIINSGGGMFYCSELMAENNNFFSPVKENFIIETEKLKNIISCKNNYLSCHINCVKEIKKLENSQNYANISYFELTEKNCGILVNSIKKKIESCDFSDAFSLMPLYIKVSDAELNYENKN